MSFKLFRSFHNVQHAKFTYLKFEKETALDVLGSRKVSRYEIWLLSFPYQIIYARVCYGTNCCIYNIWKVINVSLHFPYCLTGKYKINSLNLKAYNSHSFRHSYLKRKRIMTTICKNNDTYAVTPCQEPLTYLVSGRNLFKTFRTLRLPTWNTEKGCALLPLLQAFYRHQTNKNVYFSYVSCSLLNYFN